MLRLRIQCTRCEIIHSYSTLSSSNVWLKANNIRTKKRRRQSVLFGLQLLSTIEWDYRTNEVVWDQHLSNLHEQQLLINK
jgi:hypothetical protein